MTKFYTALSADDISHLPIRKNKKGSNVVYVIDKATNATPRIQLTTHDKPLTAPFGLSMFDESSKGRWNFDFTLDDPDLLRYFQELDEKNVQEAIKNKDTWFKAGVEDEQIRSMYYPVIRYDQKGKHPPILVCKVNIDEGPRQIRVTKLAVNKRTIRKLTPDALRAKFLRGLPNIEMSNMWFQKSQFGMTLLVSDVMIFETEVRPLLDFDLGGIVPQLVDDDGELVKPDEPNPPPSDQHPPPSLPLLPSLPSLPPLPSLSSLPSLPSLPALPSIPSLPSSVSVLVGAKRTADALDK